MDLYINQSLIGLSNTESLRKTYHF